MVYTIGKKEVYDKLLAKAARGGAVLMKRGQQPSLFDEKRFRTYPKQGIDEGYSGYLGGMIFLTRKAAEKFLEEEYLLIFKGDGPYDVYGVEADPATDIYNAGEPGQKEDWRLLIDRPVFPLGKLEELSDSESAPADQPKKEET